MASTLSPVPSVIPTRRHRGTRELILDAAENLFHRQGINVTGVQELADTASVSKRTLYQHFATKAEVVAAYLQRHVVDPNSPELALERTDFSPRERLLSVFDTVLRQSELLDVPRGCVFLNAGVEVSALSDPIHALVSEHKRRFGSRLGEVAAEAGAAEPYRLGDRLALLYDGAAARNVALGDTNPGRVARDLAESLIDAAVAKGRTGCELP